MAPSSAGSSGSGSTTSMGDMALPPISGSKVAPNSHGYSSSSSANATATTTAAGPAVSRSYTAGSYLSSSPNYKSNMNGHHHHGFAARNAVVGNGSTGVGGMAGSGSKKAGGAGGNYTAVSA
jgi:hypothetical protein